MLFLKALDLREGREENVSKSPKRGRTTFKGVRPLFRNCLFLMELLNF
ncbi:MAG: hypothetical protein ACJAZ5_001442 [Alloalcanivorax venustensis]|jgi:hypothetical protein